MEDNHKGHSKAQVKARSFIEEHNVEKILGEMLNSLVHARDPQPIIFMIKYLSNLVTEQELNENGIQVAGPLPQRIPIITYPKFDETSNSLLKRHLSRDIWSNMKKKSTSRGGNIQMCVKSGVQMPQTDIGVMATDEEAYKTFSDLFGPVVKDCHPKFDFRYSYKFEEIKQTRFTEKLDKLDHATDQVQDLQISMRRNFRGMPFSPLMTREAKLQIERRVVEVLGELCGQYYQISRIEEKEKTWLSEIGVSVERTVLHDAAGINDDFPVGRGVFIEDSREFVVLVNFEDHIQIIMLPSAGVQANVRGALSRLIKLNQTFERMGFATDAYLGYLTVSPQNLGTGMHFQGKVTMDCQNDDEAESIEQLLSEWLTQGKGMAVSCERDGNGEQTTFGFKTKQTLAPNYNEAIQIEDFLFAVQTMSDQLPAGRPSLSQRHQSNSQQQQQVNSATASEAEPPAVENDQQKAASQELQSEAPPNQ